MDHSKFREESNRFRDIVRKAMQDIEDRNGDALVLELGIEKSIGALKAWLMLGEKYFPEYFNAKYPDKKFDEYFNEECPDKPSKEKPSKR